MKNKVAQEIIEYYQGEEARKWVSAETLGLVLRLWNLMEKATKHNMPEPNLTHGARNQALLNWRKYINNDNRELLEIEVYSDGNIEFYYNGSQGTAKFERNVTEMKSMTVTTVIPKKIKDVLPLFFLAETKDEQPKDE